MASQSKPLPKEDSKTEESDQGNRTPALRPRVTGPEDAEQPSTPRTAHNGRRSDARNNQDRSVHTDSRYRFNPERPQFRSFAGVPPYSNVSLPMPANPSQELLAEMQQLVQRWTARNEQEDREQAARERRAYRMAQEEYENRVRNNSVARTGTSSGGGNRAPSHSPMEQGRPVTPTNSRGTRPPSRPKPKRHQNVSGCLWCLQKGHSCIYCTAYKSAEERQKLVQLRNWCGLCLVGSHTLATCRNKKQRNRCRHCNDFHHQAICVEKHGTEKLNHGQNGPEPSEGQKKEGAGADEEMEISEGTKSDSGSEHEESEESEESDADI